MQPRNSSVQQMNFIAAFVTLGLCAMLFSSQGAINMIINLPARQATLILNSPSCYFEAVKQQEVI